MCAVKVVWLVDLAHALFDSESDFNDVLRAGRITTETFVRRLNLTLPVLS